MRLVITAAMLSFGMMTAPAFAECSCVTSKADSSNILGEIVQSRGEVLYSGKTGFAQAKSGSKLVSGSQISTGPGASASLSVGKDCQLDLPENSEASILTLNSNDADNDTNKVKNIDLASEEFVVNTENVNAENFQEELVVQNDICLEVTSEYGQFVSLLSIPMLVPLGITAGDAGIILAVSGGDNSVSN